MESQGSLRRFPLSQFHEPKKMQLKLGTGPFWAAFLRHDCRFFVCQCAGK